MKVPKKRAKRATKRKAVRPVDHRPSEPEHRARFFRNGGSQAVRLPKEFRLPGEECVIRREGDRVVLVPLQRSWSADFLAVIDGPPVDEADRIEIPDDLPHSRRRAGIGPGSGR